VKYGTKSDPKVPEKKSAYEKVPQKFQKKISLRKSVPKVPKVQKIWGGGGRTPFGRIP
jgi:hypothetical protein